MTAVLVNKSVLVWFCLSLISLFLLLLVDRSCLCSRELCRAMWGPACTNVSGVLGVGLAVARVLQARTQGEWGYGQPTPFEMNDIHRRISKLVV